MFCDKCGNKLDDDAKFCIKCGNKVDAPIKVNSLNCPNCGATTENEDGLDTMFCKYCGTKMMLSGLSDSAYNAKVSINEMKHKERMFDKEFEYKMYEKEAEQRREDKERKRSLIGGLCILVFLFIFMGVMYVFEKQKSDNEEMYLEGIVEEVREDIKNGDYNEAYTKVQSIHYSADWSHELEEKWDAIREGLIEEINEAKESEKSKDGKKK